MTHKPILIRPYRPSDADLLLELFRDTIRRVNIAHYSLSQVRAWAPDEMDREVWAHKLAGRLCLVAEIENDVAGFSDLESDVPELGSAHLDRFFVSANHQRQGVGRALLQAMIGEAKSRSQRRVHLEASITALPFFLSQGFTNLAQQTVHVRGEALTNYRMEVWL